MITRSCQAPVNKTMVDYLFNKGQCFCRRCVESSLDAASTASAISTKAATRVWGLGTGYLKYSSVIGISYHDTLWPSIEIGLHGCAVMLLYFSLRSAAVYVLLQVQPLFNMRQQDQTAHARRDLFVFINGGYLIFNKIVGHFHFADIMVVGAYPCK